MLTLTDHARTVVEDLTTQAELPDSGGLRIVHSTEHEGAFELALVPEAAPGDDVVTSGDVSVFVAPESATMLADQQLDVASTPDGTAFTLGPQ